MPARTAMTGGATLLTDNTLSIINPSPTLLEGPRLLHQLISGPGQDGVALEYLTADGEILCLTYSELHSQAEKLAKVIQHKLRSSQNRPAIIPIFIPQSPSLYISILAILKAGAAFCPLNLDVPEERLKFILKDTSAQVILTTSELKSKLPALRDVSVVVVDERFPDLDTVISTTSSQSEPECASDSDHPLAYIMYTSGSTGLPKAVCLSHLAVTQSLLAHDRHIPNFSRFLQFASPTFDVSVFEIFFPWYRGATLVACDRGRLLGDLPGTITAMQIDAAELTPSVAASLVRTRENVPTLRMLLTIGEMLNVQVIKEFGSSDFQPSILYGMYGPTEAAIHCTLQPSFASDLSAGTIGIPLDTVSCFIVSPAESPERAAEIEVLPLGEIGELAVGGHQLADGYLNREEQTRAAFVKHPKYGNLYRTGDKARLLRDGRLECLGRISSGQVKLRGQRIELGEIEHAASKVPGCHAVVASVISGMLVVFCIVELKTVTDNDIKTACRKWLPKYMVPSDVVLLEDFPYLPSGKVDKRRLESDYNDKSMDPSSEDSPISDELTRLLGIFRSTLQVDIGLTSELGAAGLDSLKAIHLASELRRHGYTRVGALDLLAARTIQDVKAFVCLDTDPDQSASQQSLAQLEMFDELEAKCLAEPEMQRLQQDVAEILPCTPLQDAMLSETMRNPQAYCNSFELIVSSCVSPSEVLEGFKKLAGKHTLLRSGFCASEMDGSAFAQISWTKLLDSQLTLVGEFNREFMLHDLSALSRPLRIQCKESDARTEVLVQIHHALYDQWSIEVLLEDMDTLLHQREIPDRPSFRLINEHFSHVKTHPETQAPSLAFWQDYLSAVVPGHLPNLTGRTLPSAPLEAVEHSIDVDMNALKITAQQIGCSTHVFLQALYALLLSLYSGSDDVTFGTVFSGRTLPIADIENVFGPILSTLPSRVNISDARKFTDIVQRLQADNRDIMQHSSVSLADVKRACAISPAQALFDSIFVWQETARQVRTEPRLVKLVSSRDYLEFNLTLELEPTERGIAAKATYQPSVLPKDHVVIMLRQLEELLHDVIKAPGCLVQDMGQSMSTSVLSISNPTPHVFDYEAGLGNVLERHVVNSPDSPALCFAHEVGNYRVLADTLTYSDLNARANRLAHHLLSIGTLPDELICICMDKSLDLYIGILAIVKAGAGYLPLVPETPPSRIRQILLDANVKTCLTDPSTSSTINEFGICQIVEVTSTNVSTCPSTSPKVQFLPSNIAYAVFTSGTTGRPKGVLVTQENILSNLTALGSIYPVPEHSRLLQACNQAFDVSVFEIFFAWYSGMCLCSATKDILFRDLEEFINKLDITHLSLTPTVAALIAPVNVPKVKFLVTAGEAVTSQVHGAWAGKGLYQGYGPSETTNICTVNPAVEPDHAINNIGPGFENTSTFVLANSPDFRPLPTGSLGELAFGGQQVFRGYQNMPDLTRSKIIDHVQYGRIYRSGDLGRLLPDGTIIIEGRVDDQRKLRGQRIELGEISGCLLRSHAVRDCNVLIIGDNKEQERLVAFWIPRDMDSSSYHILKPNESVRKSVKSIYAMLLEELPAYMIPNLLVPVAQFPMTSQGKIDRRSLTSSLSNLQTEQLDEFAQSSEEDSSSEGLSDVEKLLASALADTLQTSLSSIKRTTSFFALGLDSVSAIRYSKNIKSRLGHQIDVSAILKRPSIASLATIIEKDPCHDLAQNKLTQSSLPKLFSHELQAAVAKDFMARERTVASILPCTPLQEAMLSASSSDSSSAYRNRTLFRLSGDVEKLRTCWEMMLERHGILRTAFISTEDPKFPFVQVVLTEFALPWQSFNFVPDDTSALLHTGEISIEDFTPPYQLRIYSSKSVAYLLLDMHHALYDGNAMSNLLSEIEQAYKGAPLSAATDFGSYLDYMVSLDADKADAFFDKQLAQFIPKPFQKRTSTTAENAFHIVKAKLPFTSDATEVYLKRHSVSLLGLVQAAWTKVLSISQGHTDVCFGNVVSGRSAPVDGVESLVAPCFNTIPTRVDLIKTKNNIALIKTLQQINVESLPFQLTPLRRIQARSSTDGQHLFDCLVLLQHRTEDLDSEIWKLEGETGEMDFPCVVEVAPANQALHATIHFDRSYFEDVTSCNRLCNAFLAAFESCMEYPSSDPSDLMEFDTTSIAGLLAPDHEYVQHAQATPGKDLTGKSVNSSTTGHWSPLELEIQDAFSAISGMPPERIAKDTTIYRMGLDSISAIQVASRLRKKGFGLSSGDIMESPSCSELASVIQSRAQTPEKNTPAFDLEGFDKRYRSRVTADLGISSYVITAVRPCTAVQSGMLSQYLHSNGDQYLNHTFYTLDEEIEVHQMQEAWTLVTEHHEMLRTGFASIDDNSHPFAMLTYKQLEIVESQLHTNIDAVYEERERAALDDIRGKLHLPPWRWELFTQDGQCCVQFSAHHALFDAETLRLIMSDMRSALALETLPRRENIDSGLSLILGNVESHRDDQQAFWTRHVQGASITRFPNLAPIRVPEAGIMTVSTIFDVSRSQLETRCRESGISMQAAGQAAWAKLLSAYTGESHVTFGVVFSGRTTPETTDCPMPCIITLPVVCNTSVNDTKLVQELMSYNAAIQKHQFTPLTDIQRFAGSPNEALFDSLFVYQRPINRGAEETTWPVVHEKATVDYAVSLELEALHDDRIGLRLTFSTSQIPTAQGQIMLKQLETILLAFIDKDALADTSILSILPPKHLELRSNTQYLHELVEHTVKQYSDRVAIEFVTDLQDTEVTSKRWTYQQLDEEGNKVAQLLVQHGIRPGGVVAASFDKCPTASFAFLGILKAGCAFCAIDPTAPTARKAFILQDSKAGLLLTNSKIVAELKDEVECGIVDLLNLNVTEPLSTQPVQLEGLSPSSVSYVLYTSGTTGTPKGCEITHENSVQAMLAFQHIFDGRHDKNSRWLQFASYHFDVSIVEQFWTWSVGMRLVCAPRDLILEDLAGFINTMQITHLDLTPSLGRLLDPELVPTLHQGVFITGGEGMRQDMVDSWGEVGCLFNFYGPTETTIGVTVFPSVPSQGKPSNIGWQFPNVGTYVLTPGTQNPVVRGAVGELCISGKLVGKGYLNRPELTEDRFPFLQRFNDRVYRTGDIVRVLHDGSIDFLGRQDNQVKLRGQRLEIDEIEAVVRKCPDIKDVICLVTKHSKQQKDLLVGFLALSSERKQIKQLELCPADSTIEMIGAARSACEEHLPGYMVPTHFIPIEVIPLSVNNKVEEKQLRTLYNNLPTAKIQEYSMQLQEQQPLSENERSIARVLASLLNIDTSEVQSRTNVFALGLSSISAIQFSRNLKTEGYQNAHVATVLKNPTVSKLAKALASAPREEAGEVTSAKQAIAACRQRYIGHVTRLLGCQVQDIEAVAPCTPLQQGIISRSLNSASSLYFNTFQYKLQNVDIDKMKKAFREAVSKAQILRTVFVETDDGYIQVVKREMGLTLVEMDIKSEQSTDEVLSIRKRDWRAKNTPDLTTPFELVLVGSSEEKVLEVHIHHALYDGISYQAFIRNVTELYNGNESCDFGKPFLDALPYGPLRTVNGAKDFWLEHLNAAGAASMPNLGQETSKQDTLYSTILDMLRPVNDARRSLNVTLQAVIQASWTAVLRQYYQGPVGTIVSGRSIDFDGAENVNGPLFNTIPFYPMFNGQDSWKTLVHRCHEFNISALPYQHTSLRDITKWCKRGPREPLFDSLFVFQSLAEDNDKARILIPQEEISFEADYPLSFEVEETAEGKLHVTVAAKGSICDETRAAELVDEFERTLSAVISDSNSPIGNTLKHDFTSSQTANTNKHKAPDTNRFSDFDWTTDASTMRNEIASLAAVDQSEIDEHVSIFELGLDSVDAVKLSSRLKKKGMSVAVSAIMRSQTIPRILSSLVKTTRKQPAAEGKDVLRRTEDRLNEFVRSQDIKLSNVERILPASPMQEALVSEMVQTSYQAYFNHDVLEIPETVDIERLEKAWHIVIDSSPILRTGFLQIDDPDFDVTFAQVVSKPCPFSFKKVQLSDEKGISKYLQQIRADAASDSLTSPHLRLTLASVSNKQFLILSIAHALYDGYSLSLLHQDVHDAYNNCYNARPFYGEVLQHDLDASNEESTGFWRSLLSGATRTHLDRKSEVSDIVTHREELFSSVSANKITSFCRQHGVTPQALCQTAWAFTLARYARSLDVMFGVVLAGRDSQLAEEVMFPMMNTVITRSVIHGSRQDMLRYMQDTIADIVQHQHFPLRKIQAACQKEVQSSTHSDAFFDTLFTFQKRPSGSDSPAQPLYESVTGASDVEYPVAVEAEILEDHLIWRTASKSNAFTAEETKEMLRSLDRVLSGIISNSEDASLSFENDGIVVCGQPPFKRAGDATSEVRDRFNRSEEPQDDNAWFTEELEIRQVIAMVTKTPEDELSKHASIQNMGVDSINAIKIASLLRSKYMRISVSEFMLAGTISKIALSIQGKKTQESTPAAQTSEELVSTFMHKAGVQAEIFGYKAEEVEQLLPATAGQVYMLSTWQASEGQIFYPEFEYSLKALTEADSIAQAWEKVVSRHPVLRTVFAVTGNANVPFVQLVLRTTPSSFTDLNAGDQPDHVPTRQPFAHLSAKKTKSGVQLRLKIHHALYDAVSLPLLVQDLEQHIQSSIAVLRQRTFADFIAQGVTEDSQKKREDFWTQYFQDQKRAQLHISPAPSTRRTESYNPNVMAIDDEVKAALRKQGLSIQSLFFAAYAKAYASLTEKDPSIETQDVVLGVYLANRSHLDDLSSLAAPTLNLLPLSIKAPHQTDIIATAKQIQTDLQTISSPENSSAGLWEIEKWTGVKVDNFVNFIKLPDGDDIDYGKSEGAIVDEIGGRLKTEKRSLVHEGITAEFKQPKELEKNIVKNAYPVSCCYDLVDNWRGTNVIQRSLDVEATVSNEYLGVGVFAWEDMVGLERAEALIVDIAEALRGAL